jgi:hypothetical protein
MTNTIQDINELKQKQLNNHLNQNMAIDSTAIQSSSDNWVLAQDPNQPDAPMIEWDNTVTHTFDVVGTYLSTEKDQNNQHREIPFRIVSAHLPEPLRFKDETVAQFGAEGAFKNQLAAELMPLLYPDFKRLRHYRVYNVTSWRRGNRMELPSRVVLMDRNQCLAFRETSSRLSIVDPAMYPQLVDLQTAMLACLDDPRGFQVQQHIRRRHQQKHMAGDTVRSTNSGLLESLKQTMIQENRQFMAHSKAGKFQIEAEPTLPTPAVQPTTPSRPALDI